jgi:hypothetical protein
MQNFGTPVCVDGELMAILRLDLELVEVAESINHCNVSGSLQSS